MRAARHRSQGGAELVITTINAEPAELAEPSCAWRFCVFCAVCVVRRHALHSIDAPLRADAANARRAVIFLLLLIFTALPFIRRSSSSSSTKATTRRRRSTPRGCCCRRCPAPPRAICRSTSNVQSHPLRRQRLSCRRGSSGPRSPSPRRARRIHRPFVEAGLERSAIRRSAPAFAEGFGASAVARCASGGGKPSGERPSLG